MSIVGERPESGFRVDLLLAADAENACPEGAPKVLRYQGHVYLPASDHAATCLVHVGQVGPGGASGPNKIEIEVTPPLPDDIERKVVMLVRTLVEPERPTRRIHRWRGEK